MDKAVGILHSFDSQRTPLPSTYHILMFGVWVPLWKWHAFNYMLGLACSTAITHKNRSFLSYKMEPLRYDPSGNATWPPIALPQIAFCTWLQVHLRSFLRLVVLFLQHTHTHTSEVSYSTQRYELKRHNLLLVLCLYSLKHANKSTKSTGIHTVPWVFDH